MKKCIVLLLVILIFVAGCGEAKPKPNVKTDTDTGTKTGWHYVSKNTFYLDGDGIPVTGWQTIDGSRYYFCPDRGGAMVTGWLELAGKEYYLRPDGDMAVGTVCIDGQAHHFTSAGETFLLVNHNNPVPNDFRPKLTELEGFRVAEDCATPLKNMMEACRAAGYRCVINSAYRDVAYQQMLWDNRYNDYIAQGYSAESSAELTSQKVLPPGTSEHHTGLAVDITGSEQMYSWLAEHAPEYGFILRYPQDKIQWTGIVYEPWHFRYVGRELALELQALNLTVEEYLYQLTRQ